MLDPLLSERDLIAISKAQEAEFASLVKAGKVLPEHMRVPAWKTVAVVMATSKSPRTKLMAARMYIDRTDPIVEPEKKPDGPRVLNVAVILEGPKEHTNGHALPGVKIALEERNGGS